MTRKQIVFAWAHLVVRHGWQISTFGKIVVNPCLSSSVRMINGLGASYLRTSKQKISAPPHTWKQRLSHLSTINFQCASLMRSACPSSSFRAFGSTTSRLCSHSMGQLSTLTGRGCCKGFAIQSRHASKKPLDTSAKDASGTSCWFTGGFPSGRKAICDEL